MAERSSSVSGGKSLKLFQARNDSGKDSKSKKQRRRKQKQEKMTEKSLENVQAAESSVLSTAEHSESNPNFEELVQSSGEHEDNLGHAVENEPTAELVQDSRVLEASASNLAEAEGTSDSRQDLPSEEKLVTAEAKDLPKEQRADASDDGEGKGSADKSLEQQRAKNMTDLLSFGRSKKNKTQREKSAAQKASGEKNRDSAGAKEDSSSGATKSKFLGKENEQEQGEDREMAEPGAETSAIKDAANTPEDIKTVENNEGQIDEHEKALEAMNAAGSNKAKKFKPLASFRRHKKKADTAKSASADENIGEKAETKQHLKADCDEVFDDENGDKVSNNEEDEKAESNENAKKKSTGKKFGPLHSFRRSKATKKSTEAGRDGAGKAKEKNENSQEKDAAEEENCQDSEVLQEEHGAQQAAVPEGLSEECTGEENPELIPEEEEIQDKCGADADAEAITPTKKEKKKGLLRRRMKKIWSTSGKTKAETNNMEKAEENVSDEESEVQGDNGDQQVSSQNPPNPPAEASSEEREATETLATDQEELESADLISTAEKMERADEINLEAAPIEDSHAEMQSTEKTEKIAGLFGRQIKKSKKSKKSKENQTKKGDEETLTEESTGTNGADKKEITKQVKRKRSGFQKISNALKKKKSREEGWPNEDETEGGQGPRAKEPQETDRRTASAEVNPAEDEEQRPLNHDKAEGREINDGEAEHAPQSDQEETEKISDSEECPSEEEEVSESVESPSCQGASSIEAYKAHGNLMKPVIQELLAKMAKSAPAEPEIEPEEDSESTKTSDDYSLTEVTSTTGDWSPSFADACYDGNQDGVLSDDAKDADAVKDSAECVPSAPEAERQHPDETKSIEIPTCDATGSALPTSIPEVPNAAEAEESGKRALTEDVEKDSEIRKGSDDSEEGDNEESEASQEGQKREDLDNSDARVTSDLDSSQTAASKGRKEDWILVNRLEISQELSHQLKVLALDSFEHGNPGCCCIM